MRISDWVQTCALPISRLAGLEGFDLDRGRGERGDETRLVAFLAAAANPEEIVGDQLFERGCILRGDGRIERGRRFAISVDRKSVVSRKSVSVRVDIGGSRII